MLLGVQWGRRCFLGLTDIRNTKLSPKPTNDSLNKKNTKVIMELRVSKNASASTAFLLHQKKKPPFKIHALKYAY